MELKTKPTGQSVDSMLNTTGDEGRRRLHHPGDDAQSRAVRAAHVEVEHRGFGDTHQKYANGRELYPAYLSSLVVIPLTINIVM